MKNQKLAELISLLKEISAKQEVKLWRRVALDLEKPSKNRRVVNLTRINRYCKDNDVIIIPGKVLSMGSLDKKLTIAAYNFSKKALEKINKSGSKAVSINDLIKKNPKAKNIRIIG